MLLSGERMLNVVNIAWGGDLGDDFEHLTTNISPTVNGTTVDFFFTDEVASITDPETGAIIWQSDVIPNVR